MSLTSGVPVAVVASLSPKDANAVRRIGTYFHSLSGYPAESIGADTLTAAAKLPVCPSNTLTCPTSEGSAFGATSAADIIARPSRHSTAGRNDRLSFDIATPQQGSVSLPRRLIRATFAAATLTHAKESRGSDK